jgi:hypothetical protein
MIRPRKLFPLPYIPLRFVPCGTTCTVPPDFFTSPYVSSLKEPEVFGTPLPCSLRPVCFSPNGKGCVFKLLLPDLFWRKDRQQLEKVKELLHML